MRADPRGGEVEGADLEERVLPRRAGGRGGVEGECWTLTRRDVYGSFKYPGVSDDKVSRAQWKTTKRHTAEDKLVTIG